MRDNRMERILALWLMMRYHFYCESSSLPRQGVQE